VAFASTAFAAVRPNYVMRGVPQVGAQGVSRTMRDIMIEQESHAGEPVVPILQPEMEGPDRSNLPMNPASPRVASIPQMPVDQMTHRMAIAPGQGPFTPQTVGVNFTAATLSGTNSTGSFPPDNNGAVGPTQYIVAVNGRIVSFNKTTGVADGVMNATTNTFFTSVRNASSTSDPMIRYDRLSNRWFISIINVSTPNRWLLAVSDAASNGVISAGTVWTYYFFIPATTSPTVSNGSTCLSDYPSLGIDANALYTGVSEFCGTGQPFQQTDVFVIRKSSVLSGGPIVVTAFRGLMTATGGYVGPWSARGVDNYDPTSNEGYFISTDGASYGTMWLNRVGTPGGTPTLSSNIAITLPADNGPRPVPHPSNTGGYWGRLDPLDDRFFAVHIRNQQLWTAHNISCDNTGVSQGTYLGDTRVGSRWYHLNVPVNTGTPNIVESGTIFKASATNDSLQASCFIPSVMVSGQGHVAMGYTQAGETNFINAMTVGRLASDPAGTMETPVQITTNAANTYNPTSDPGGISAGRPRRWGDYSITSLDPLDDMSMWTIQQFVDANNSYGVRVAKLIAPPPATPSALADVVVGQPSISVTLTGTSAAGSGFYDPGANLASPAPAFTHISASCSAGAATGTPPSVVSVTYVNPTTVTVVLNTTAATANLTGEKYTLTVTNPDGQTASGAVVHVVNTTITASAGANGSISPSGAVTVPYNTNQTFTITANPCFSVANVIVDGSSVGAVNSYTFSNVVANHTISATFAAGLTNAPTGVSASQVKTGNSGSTTGIKVNYTVPVGSSSVEVWRAPFGSYPLFSTPPGSGVVPALPGSYPPAGWTLTGITASGQADVPPSRDYWYYVAYGRDGCGDVSPVSAMTGGTLDYHLGDVSDGITPGTGDDVVSTPDASLLGAHYGATGLSLAGYEYLDFGPTTDFSTNGRPTADGVVDFEDLVMLALNYTPHVSAPQMHIAPLATSAGEVLSVSSPLIVQRGDEFDVPVTLKAGGELQALSMSLAWDRAVVVPVGVKPGALITAQGGVVLSPGPGRADAAMLGAAQQGLVGEGTVATMRFRAIEAGSPGISVAHVVGRDVANHSVTIATHDPGVADGRVTATEFYPVVPNPTHGSSLVRYSLVRRGAVNVAVYSVDGRLVKSLAHGVQEPGQYQIVWDGTDASGGLTKPGMFYVRFEAEGVRKSRVLSVIR
jgi:hypothetical protein